MLNGASLLRYCRICAAVLLATLAAACSSSPDPMLASLKNALPAPGTARMVIYYPGKLVGSDGLVQVKFDESASCSLSGGSYIVRDILPGKHAIAISFCGMPGTSFIGVTAVAGEKYYVRVKPYDSSITGVLSGYPSETVEDDAPKHKGPFLIERILEPAALTELESMTYSSNNGAIH